MGIPTSIPRRKAFAAPSFQTHLRFDTLALLRRGAAIEKVRSVAGRRSNADGGQIEFHPRGMEAPSGERDDGGYRGHSGRAERSLGAAQRELCQWQRAQTGENRPWVEPADQGSGRRLRDL